MRGGIVLLGPLGGCIVLGYVVYIFKQGNHDGKISRTWASEPLLIRAYTSVVMEYVLLEKGSKLEIILDVTCLVKARNASMPAMLAC